MKKIILIILLLITGCSENKNEVINNIETKEEQKQVIEYIDDNPIKIGIYENDIKLVKEYQTKKQVGNEIIFGFYYTDIENLGNSRQKENWYKFYNQYSNINNYKIGFSFSFYVGDKKIEKTILKPEIYAFNPYFYIYMYDDINQPDNTFYSHIEENEVIDTTIFSSIKIYLVEPFSITSKIKFTVFTYDDLEDFDENNNYRGNSKYSVDIDLI